MIELSEDIDRIKPCVGYVIVEVPFLTKETKGAFSLQLLSDISIGDYTVRSGIVVSTNGSDVPSFNFLYDGPVQVEKGDRVWWAPNATQQIANTELEQYRMLKIGEKLYLSIPYKFLVMRLRDGERAGLNDYVITEAISEDCMKHRVIAGNLPGTTYTKIGDVLQESEEVKEGWDIVVKRPCKMFLENKDDMELPGRWIALQSHYIFGRI